MTELHRARGNDFLLISSAVEALALLAEFEALPIKADGWTRVPPALRRAIVDLGLDVLSGPDSHAGAPEILRILTTTSRA